MHFYKSRNNLLNWGASEKVLQAGEGIGDRDPAFYLQNTRFWTNKVNSMTDQKAMSAVPREDVSHRVWNPRPGSTSEIPGDPRQCLHLSLLIILVRKADRLVRWFLWSHFFSGQAWVNWPQFPQSSARPELQASISSPKQTWFSTSGFERVLSKVSFHLFLGSNQGVPFLGDCNLLKSIWLLYWKVALYV